MWQGIYKFIQHCAICQANKGFSHNVSLYLPLSIPNSIWEDLNIDFVLGLPRTRSRAYSIMVVVDRLFKMAHFIGYKMTFYFNNIAKLFFKEIVWLHGTPHSILFDRDTKFVSSFWKELWNHLGTSLRISTAYHPQMDRQIEVVNKTLDNMLRCIVVDHAKPWDTILGQEDFAYNSTVNRSLTRLLLVLSTPRSLSHSWHCHPSTKQTVFINYYDSWLFRLNHRGLQSVTNCKPTNLKWKCIIFQPDNLVMLHTQKERFPSGTYSKLKPQKIGPFAVHHWIKDNVYVIDLPPELNINPTFNVSDLHPYHPPDEVDVQTSELESISSDTRKE